GVRFHRILKGAVIQGGDISGGGESGGESVYGEKFDDENFELRHERKEMFLMVNTGPILMGLNSLLLLLKPINSMLMLINRPLLDIVIENCGEIPEGDDSTWWVTAAEGIKVFGNQNFKKQDYKMAIRKYLKAMWCLDMCWDMESLDGGDHFVYHYYHVMLFTITTKSLSLRNMRSQLYTSTVVMLLHII
ncbi:Peptidyl-prolyl cis-trans isomerase CYP40, partial [Bienertia sinuspersici]